MIWRNVMMAASLGASSGPITFVGGVTATVNTGASTTLLLPSGIQVNDVIVVVMGSDTGTPQLNTSGYSIRANGFSSVGGGYYTKFATSGDSSVAVTGSTTNPTTVVVCVYRGVSTSNPFTISNPLLTTSISTDPTPPSLSSSQTVAGCLVLAIGIQDDDGNASVTAPAGFTDLTWNSTSSSGTGNNCTIAISSRTLANPQNLTIGSYSFDPGSDSVTSITDVLRPA